MWQHLARAPPPDRSPSVLLRQRPTEPPRQRNKINKEKAQARHSGPDAVFRMRINLILTQVSNDQKSKNLVNKGPNVNMHGFVSIKLHLPQTHLRIFLPLKLTVQSAKNMIII
jgi:hypothetical protein